MQRIGEMIRKLRTDRSQTQDDVAAGVGVSKSTVSMWESGQRNLTLETLEAIADYFNVPMAFFLDEATPYNLLPIKYKRIPLLGRIAAGVPIYADEDLETQIAVDHDLHCDFALKVTGDSMINARIQDDDIVFIREQPDVNDGEIAAVIIDDSATLKRVYHMPGGVTLVAENPKYAPMTFTQQNSDSVRILGKVVAFQSYV
jgi:repressor LexA